jgi:ABC-type amino acid transport substrate-binding protein
MERVRENEVNTVEEVAKAFNRIIDKINENDEYNKLVDEHNDGLIKKGK